MELTIRNGTVALPATLTLPSAPAAGAMILLHGANCGTRDHFLYEHIADVMPRVGVAVLRYDRRDGNGFDVPFAVQASDAMAAVSLLRQHVPDVPVGLFGYSQGGWVATLAAARHPRDIAFVVSLSSPGVSPGDQMRFSLANTLRANGHEDELPLLAATQDALYGYIRGDVGHAEISAALALAATRPWHPLTGFRTEVPAGVDPRPTWIDLDYDPAPAFAAVECPVLAIFGANDQVTPVARTIEVWAESTGKAGRPAPEVVILDGCGHPPTLEGRPAGPASISPAFTEALTTWIPKQVKAPGTS